MAIGEQDNSNLRTWIKERCQDSLNLRIIKSVLIRCLKAAGKPNYEQLICIDPTAVELEIAENLIFLAHMDSTSDAWSNGKL